MRANRFATRSVWAAALGCVLHARCPADRICLQPAKRTAPAAPTGHRRAVRALALAAGALRCIAMLAIRLSAQVSFEARVAGSHLHRDTAVYVDRRIDRGGRRGTSFTNFTLRGWLSMLPKYHAPL